MKPLAVPNARPDDVCLEQRASGKRARLSNSYQAIRTLSTFTLAKVDKARTNILVLSLIRLRLLYLP